MTKKRDNRGKRNAGRRKKKHPPKRKQLDASGTRRSDQEWELPRGPRELPAL